MKVSVPLDLAGMESRPSTIFHNGWILVDVAKRAGRVGFGSGQSGLRVKRVTG